MACLTPRKVEKTPLDFLSAFSILVGKFFLVLWCGFFLAQASADTPQTKKTFQFDLPAQPLAQSLTAVSNQTETLVLFPFDLVEHRQANAINGRYTIQAAFYQLLREPDLVAAFSEQGVLVISTIDAGVDNNRGDKTMNAKKNLLAATIGFFGGVGASGVVAQADSEGTVWALEEVVVTARKQEGSLQDTAIAITAIGADEIDKRGLVSMDDYLRNIPGVSMQDRGALGNSIVIRGMAANPQSVDSSTAGAYFGETPISNIRSASQSGAVANADIKLIDIERVEVLRGPQGTLYGSGSMAGTARIIPNAPVLDEIEGHVATRLSNTAEKGGDNYSVEGVINVPLIEDKLAVRAVAYRIDNSGFIDNVAASEPTDRIQEFIDEDGIVVKDVGDRGGDITTGFRLAALWQVTDQLDATLSYIQQDIEQDGLREVELDIGTYKQARWQVGEDRNQDEFVDNEFELTNLVINYDLGWAGLTSSSSWIDNDSAIGMNGSSTAHYRDNTANVDWFIEELRLSSQWEGPIQLITGLYYEDKDVENHNFWGWSGDPALDPYPAPGLPKSMRDGVVTTEQVAFFGELTYEFTEQWEATIGGRHFDYDLEEISSLISNGNVRRIDGKTTISEDGQNYKGALSYIPSENLLVYGQWAEGFRLGFPQNGSTACSNASEPISIPGVESDSAETFELGVKSSWGDNRFVLNAAIYRTNWDNIPVRIVTPTDAGNCSRSLNAGKAISEGIEVELQALITESLRIDVSASTVDSTLDEEFDFGSGLVGEKGDDLPGSADYNATIGLEYGFNLGESPSFVRLDYAYVGEYYNNFEKNGTPAGDFSQVHLKLGTQIGQVALDVFVNNLTNDDALTWVEQNFTRFSGTSPAYRIRPRTMGVNVKYHF